MMKSCFVCGNLLPLNEFYKHSGMKDGHLNKCKECTRKHCKKHRDSHIERYREYDRARGKTSERIQKCKDYNKTDLGKIARKKAVSKSNNKFPERRRARIKLGNAIRDGLIIKQPCCICGDEAQGHHPDYSRPLDVVWLCNKHHKETHDLIEDSP